MACLVLNGSVALFTFPTEKEAIGCGLPRNFPAPWKLDCMAIPLSFLRSHQPRPPLVYVQHHGMCLPRIALPMRDVSSENGRGRPIPQ